MNYVILSLKHSEGRKPTFWRPDNAGYTIYPWAAGVYTEDQIKKDPDYYNDGFNTIAVPISESGIRSIGLEITMDLNKVNDLAEQAAKERTARRLKEVEARS